MKKKTDIIVKLLASDIVGKSILEVACGCAELSISAARDANDVYCIDIDDSRLPDVLPENIYFEKMDASNMRYSEESFDTIIIYNAFYHIYAQWDSIKKECLRVLKPAGKLFIISTWKLDNALMNDVFNEDLKKHKDFLIAELSK